MKLPCLACQPGQQSSIAPFILHLTAHSAPTAPELPSHSTSSTTNSKAPAATPLLSSAHPLSTTNLIASIAPSLLTDRYFSSPLIVDAPPFHCRPCNRSPQPVPSVRNTVPISHHPSICTDSDTDGNIPQHPSHPAQPSRPASARLTLHSCTVRHCLINLSAVHSLFPSQARSHCNAGTHALRPFYSCSTLGPFIECC